MIFISPFVTDVFERDARLLPGVHTVLTTTLKSFYLGYLTVSTFLKPSFLTQHKGFFKSVLLLHKKRT